MSPQERAVVQQLVDALEYHQQQTRPIQRTEAALAEARALLAAAPSPVVPDSGLGDSDSSLRVDVSVGTDRAPGMASAPRDERAAFEAWMRQKNSPLRANDLKWHESDGSYDNTGVNAAWNGWQASAARIGAELSTDSVPSVPALGVGGEFPLASGNRSSVAIGDAERLSAAVVFLEAWEHENALHNADATDNETYFHAAVKTSERAMAFRLSFAGVPSSDDALRNAYAEGRKDERENLERIGAVHDCPACDGRGEKMVTFINGPDAYQDVIDCPDCAGTGFECRAPTGAGNVSPKPNKQDPDSQDMGEHL